MKKILFAIFTLASLNCFAQQWVEYKVDSNLTVTIPNNYVIIDTLGQHIIRAQVSNALVMIQRIANAGETARNIQTKDELIKSYTGFQKGAVESQHGKLLDQQMLEKEGLRMTQFSFAVTMGEEKQIRHYQTVFLNENWYTISFWEVEALTNELKGDRDKLFSSIKFPAGASLKNQLSNSMEGSTAYRSGYLFGKLLTYALLIAGAVALVRWISKKGKQKKQQSAS
jgi:hypothetical protein